MRLYQPSSERNYQYEILRARNEIRDHFSRTFIKDIYENSGQLISLMRVKLAVAMKDPARKSGTEITILKGRKITDRKFRYVAHLRDIQITKFYIGEKHLLI